MWPGFRVPHMDTNTQLSTLQLRIRSLREARNLTLQETSDKSGGLISAIALGSYERGDRSISAKKLIQIAQLYDVPVSALFDDAMKVTTPGRVTFDLRRVNTATDDVSLVFAQTLKRMAHMRRDWNGEVISLRSSDITNFALFTGLSPDEIEAIVGRFSLARLLPT